MFDPVTIAAAGQFLGGAGAVMSGLGIGKSKTPDPAYQSALTLQHERNAFAQKMALAKEHGIHPLAMLGLPSSNFSPVYSSGGGASFSDIGYGVEQAAKSLVKPEAASAGVQPEQSPAPVTDAIEGQRQRMIDAQVRRAEAEANLAELSVYNALEGLRGQAGRPPSNVSSNDVNSIRGIVAKQSGIPIGLVGGDKAPITVKQDVLPPHPNRPGQAAGTNQAWLNLQDSNGQTTVLNSDAVNADIEKGATLTALAKVFGLERAMQITAVLENENLLVAGGVATGYILRHPAARAAKYLGGLVGSRLPKLYKPTKINAPKGGTLNRNDQPYRARYPDIYPY